MIFLGAHMLIFLWIALALIFLGGFVAIIVVPQLTVPDEIALDRRIELRDKIRATTAQIVGGFAVVITFLHTVIQTSQNQQNFNRDLKQKYDQETAELFAKAVTTPNAESLYALGYIAKRDEYVHGSVFDQVALYIKKVSKDACKNEAYKKLEYVVDPQIQIAIRVFGERDTSKDIVGKIFNLEGACLAGIDLKDEYGVIKGLSGARISGARLLRADLTKAALQKTELMGIEAGDRHNEGWTLSIGRALHRGADGSIRRRYVTSFIDSNLTNANLEGAGLEGADFSGAVLTDAVLADANISRANFSGAVVTLEQLMSACVEDYGADAESMLDQPILSEKWQAKLMQELSAKGGIKHCR